MLRPIGCYEIFYDFDFANMIISINYPLQTYPSVQGLGVLTQSKGQVMVPILSQKQSFAMGYYRPQRSYGQGYVFTRICHSVNTGVGGVCLIPCMLGYHHHPTPPPPGADSSPSPGADTPLPPPPPPEQTSLIVSTERSCLLCVRALSFLE